LRTPGSGWSNAPSLSVVGLQWGDEGKGKIVDFLAGDYDAVVRFNGGSNAGHTVVIGDRRHTFHLIPSGALKGKDLLVGPGVAVDPVVLAEELSLLPSETRRRLTVDGRCSLVTPMDKELDRVLEEMRGTSAIGTTKRGIGPAYALRALRLSPRVTDLLGSFDFGPMRSFYGKFGLDPAGLIAWAADSKALVEGMTGDVSARISELVDSGGSVLYETSQGTLLDLLHGSYPYVTSTHTVASYIPAALGLPARYAGDTIGVTKCYVTRVGGGPFPTELPDQIGDAIRSLGNEYGATTGRPRRVGWLDLVALRYAVNLNGVKNVALSKVDVLSRVKDFKVCVAYRMLGSETRDFHRSLGHLGEVEPVFDGPFTLRGAQFSSGLPPEGKKFVDYLEESLNVKVSLVSYGDDRSKTIEP
jgi:adenylosuccinate synthase